MNNMWQVQMQQLLQHNGGLQQGMQQPRGPAESNPSGQRGHRHFHQDNNNYQRQGNSGNSYDRHRRESQRGDFYHHDDRSGGHNRNHPPERRRDSREGRWKPF